MSNRKPPEWVIKLPPGKYDSHELMKITGVTSACITKALKRYGAIIEKVDSGYNNLLKNIFIWKGYQKINDERRKSARIN